MVGVMGPGRRGIAVLSIVAAAVVVGGVTFAVTRSGKAKHPPSALSTASTTAPASPTTTEFGVPSTTGGPTTTTTTTTPSSTTTVAPRPQPARWIYVTAGNSFDVVDVPGGTVNHPGGPVYAAAVAPDRSKVALDMQTQAGDLSHGASVFVAGSGAVSPVRVSDPQQDTAEFALAWAPDGTKVAYGSQVPVSGGAPTWEIVVVNADGTGRRQLTTGANLHRGPPVTDLAWSADGRTIAFASDDAASMATIKRVDVASGSMSTVAVDAGGLYNLVYRSDGHLLADEASGGVVEIAADGSSLRRITPAGEQTFGFALSPDGRTVAYNTAGALKIIPVIGGRSKAFGATNAAYVPPVWSADGSALLTVTPTGAGAGTYAVRLADGAVTAVHHGDDDGAWW